MSRTVHIKTISELCKAMKQPGPHHPLVTVLDFTKVEETFETGTTVSTDFYSIMFKNYCSNVVKYGRQYYDFQDGNLIFISPKQVLTFDDEIAPIENPMGWGLFFHPDLLRNSPLGSRIREYSFFSYELSEALHLSEKEKQTLYDCILKIENELKENIDNYSQTLIVSNIELLLNYCSRYYGRQFITRKNANNDILKKVERLLKDYVHSDAQKEKGLPTVKYLAEQVYLSPGYLGDLLKKETGMNAQDHIHYFLIEEAKNILKTSSKSVGEIADTLGFEYPQYFSKLFKQKTGLSPVEYRNMN